MAVETLNKGVIFQLNGNFDQAIIQYNKALEIDPNFFEAWAYKGEALMNLKRYEEALNSFDRALYFKNDSAEVWLNRGYTLGELARYTEALESLEKSIKFNHSDEKAWYNKGNMLGILGNYEEAVQSYDVALSINKNYSKAWYNKGYYLNTIGKYNEAVDSYDKATTVNPNYTDAWYNRGNTLARLGRYHEAIDSYSNALVINQNDAKSLVGEGNTLSIIGLYDEALTKFDKAIKIDPNYSGAWYNRGNTLYLMRNYSAAKESNQRAIKLSWKTKKVDIGTILEVDPDLRNDQIGVVGKTYTLLVELNAKDDIDLSNNIYIEFNKNGRQITFNNSNEILVDVLIDGNDYWGPLVYNLENKLGRQRILPKGQSDSFKVNVTFLSPGVYNILITTHERLVPYVIQIVDPLTMRDLKNGITSLQVAQESKEISERSLWISIIAALIAVIGAILGSIVTSYLSKKHDRQKAKTKFVNLANIKLDNVVTIRETWIKADYRKVKDNFISISNELLNIIPLIPDDFPDEILNELLNLIKSLYELSPYNFSVGIDTTFEEKTQKIVDDAKRIKQKLK